MNDHNRVDIVTRSDVRSKPGGDYLQMVHYQHHLRALGVDVQIVPFTLDYSPRAGAIVHLTNVDRPFEYLWLARKYPCHVVSTIHHSLGDVRTMHRAEGWLSLRGLVGRLVPLSLRELIGFSLRRVREDDFWRTIAPIVWAVGVAVRGVWRSVGSALDGAAMVAVLSQKEVADLRADTAWSAANWRIIPNGNPSTPVSERSWEERRGICVVGRLEPRKRQVELAEAAVRFGARVTFIGAGNPNAGGYVRKFARLIESSASIGWLGALSQEDTHIEMARHRVLLNGSLAEVQSLVDIEARRLGLYVVGGVVGSSAEWLGSGCVSVQSNEASDLLLTSIRLESGEPPPASSYSFSWSDAAESLSQVYQFVYRRSSDLGEEA